MCGFKGSLWLKFKPVFRSRRHGQGAGRQLTGGRPLERDDDALLAALRASGAPPRAALQQVLRLTCGSSLIVAAAELVPCRGRVMRRLRRAILRPRSQCDALQTVLEWCVRREIMWTEGSEEHIRARHQVTPAEVEEVVNTRPRLVEPGRDDTEQVFGTTNAGRHLLVVLADALDGRDYVVTARDMTDTERRKFRRRAR